MTKESIALINGHEYKYRYNPETKLMDYLGPVGDAPPLTEVIFRKAMVRQVQIRQDLLDMKDDKGEIKTKDLYPYLLDKLEFSAEQIEYALAMKDPRKEGFVPQYTGVHLVYRNEEGFDFDAKYFDEDYSVHIHPDGKKANIVGKDDFYIVDLFDEETRIHLDNLNLYSAVLSDLQERAFGFEKILLEG
jgi:hypothetical protein